MIKKGDIVFIKPQWQEPGDDKFTWKAIDDEENGRVTICPIDIDMKIQPTEVVKVSTMLDLERTITTLEEE